MPDWSHDSDGVVSGVVGGTAAEGCRSMLQEQLSRNSSCCSIDFVNIDSLTLRATTRSPQDHVQGTLKAALRAFRDKSGCAAAVTELVSFPAVCPIHAC